MANFHVIAQYNSQLEMLEFRYIYRVAVVCLRAKQLGKQARARMKKGDYSSKPNKKYIEKQMDIVKGYL